MRFFSAHELVAVDLGTHTVKLLVLSERKGRWRVERLLTIQTGITNQTPQEQVLPRQGAALMALLKSAGIRGKEAVSAIPGRAVFFRPLRIPAVGGERLDRIVRYEARQQIPFPLDQVIYDFHQFNTTDVDVDVTLVAAKKELINEHVDTLRTAGLSVEYLDVSTIAVFNSFVIGHPGMINEVVAVVDIGASTTDIVICSDRALRFMRSAPVAGNHLTQSVASIFAIPFEEAEQLKCRTFAHHADGEPPLRINVPGENRVVDAVNRSMEDIVNEVRRSLDFFVSRPEGVPVNTVILTGGSSRIPGICEFFEERLGLDVMLEPGFAIEGIDTTLVEREQVPLANVVLGLAAKASQKAPVDMNFTPVSIRQTQAIRERRPSFLLEGVLVGAVIALLATNVGLELYYNRQVLANVESVLELVEKTGAPLGNAIRTQRDLGERLNKLQQIAYRRGFLLATVGELSRLKPEGVWIESVTMSIAAMGIRGRAEQEKYVRDFVTNLSVSPYFNAPGIRAMGWERGTIQYEIQIGWLTGPDPMTVAFIDGIRKNLRAVRAQQRRTVEVRTATIIKEKQQAEVYYTHLDIRDRMLEDLYRSAVGALVDSGAGEVTGGVKTLRIIAVGVRGDTLPFFSKAVDYEVAKQLHLNTITFEEFKAQMKDIPGLQTGTGSS